MYSQNNEEQFILDHYKGKPPGRFLDIGAYDGKTLSNTMALVDLGWEGVCLEASPTVFNGLLKTHSNNPKITLINAALGFKREFVKFYDSQGDAVSTFTEENRLRWSSAVKFLPFYVFTMTMEDLFGTFGYEFDFINLDIEGISFEMFRRMPLATLRRTTCWCIEHDGYVAQAVALGRAHGYALVDQNAENVILTRAQVPSELPPGVSPGAVFPGA
jgi:FkbM family methyltransferase